MVVRKESPQPYLSTPSPELSPPASTVFSECEADDEDVMSTEEHIPSRPLSLAHSDKATGCLPSRLPTLQEILSNSAPQPYTLSAFTAYLSQNHCLENLEFIKEADRYRVKYDEMMSGSPEPAFSDDYRECEDVRNLWNRVLQTYVVPNTPREINIPSEVRDALVALPNVTTPPHPEVLEPAVKAVSDLMNDSILMAFIHDLSPAKPPSSIGDEFDDAMEHLEKRSSLEGEAYHARPRRKTSPPKQAQVGQFASSLRHSHTFSSGRGTGKLVAHPSTSSTGSDPVVFTDDSLDMSSPMQSPMTPPTTPPSSELGGTSPKSRNDNTFRKMMGRLNSKRKPSGRTDRIGGENLNG